MVDWWVPILAGFVGGTLPAAMAIYSTRAQMKLQRDHLTHDHAERLRARAARAYELGFEAPKRIASSARLRKDLAGYEDGMRAFMPSFEATNQLCKDALAELGYLTIDVWSKPVAQAASAARDALATAESLGDSVMHEISRQQLAALEAEADVVFETEILDSMCSDVEDAAAAASAAIEDFRAAVLEP